MVELVATQVIGGTASELSFRSLPPGNYIVTVLPAMRNLPETSELVGSTTVHAEHVLVMGAPITGR